MKHFTPEDVLSNISEKFQPRAMTLEIIRQIAYAYPVNNSQSIALN